MQRLNTIATITQLVQKRIIKKKVVVTNKCRSTFFCFQLKGLEIRRWVSQFPNVL